MLEIESVALTFEDGWSPGLNFCALWRLMGWAKLLLPRNKMLR